MGDLRGSLKRRRTKYLTLDKITTFVQNFIFSFVLPSWMLLDVKCLLYNLFIAPNCFLLVDFALKGNQGSFLN